VKRDCRSPYHRRLSWSVCQLRLVVPMGFLIGLLAGCYTLPPAQPPAGQGKPAAGGTGPGAAAPPTASGAQVPVPAARGTGNDGRSPARVDSSPSPEALAVLASIPEPLAPSDRVPPAASGTVDTARLVANADSLADSTQADIPIPTPTLALGQRASSPDTTSPSSVAPPVTATAPPGGTGSLPGAVSPTTAPA